MTIPQLGALVLIATLILACLEGWRRMKDWF